MEIECFMATESSRLFTIFTACFIVVGFVFILGWLVRCLHRWLYSKFDRYRKMCKSCAKVRLVLTAVFAVVIVILFGFLLYTCADGFIDVWRCLNG